MPRTPAHFTSVATPRAFEAILAQLKAAIAAGTLRAGDRLPAERDLAEEFQASRTSVREALRVLEALGIIRVRRGAEHGAVLLSEPGNAFTTVLDLLVALGHIPLDDVVEFRVMLESSAARQLAAAPDPGALADLRVLLEQMEEPRLARADFHRLDAEFHVTLMRSTGNRLVNVVETAADGTLRALIADVGMVGANWSTVRRRLIGEHRRIYETLVDGSGQAAADLVSDHIRFWGRSVIAATPVHPPRSR